MTRLWPVLLLCILMGCRDRPLDAILRDGGPDVSKVISDASKHEVQIIYVQIDRDRKNRPGFTEYRYRVKEDEYFYPASTVKLPVAVLALEKLHELHIPGLDRNARMRIDSARSPQSAMMLDSTSESGVPSVAHFIHQVFLVSDNNAHNRLYEFLGQEELHQRLRKHDLHSARIIHRLSAPEFSPDANRFTNPVSFYHQDTLILQQPEQVSPPSEDKDAPLHQFKGKGFTDASGNLITTPFDFSRRNFFPLHEQVQVLKAILFPDEMKESERFCLAEEDYQFLRREMGLLPRESRFPLYDTTEYYDGYAKFFMTGDSRAQLPDGVRILNKAGWAYGYLTDCAYIVDFEHQVEFILAATLLVNENEIFNDGQYEFEETGKPFIAQLGRAVYEYELRRDRRYRPDLSALELLFAEP